MIGQNKYHAGNHFKNRLRMCLFCLKIKEKNFAQNDTEKEIRIFFTNSAWIKKVVEYLQTFNNNT